MLASMSEIDPCDTPLVDWSDLGVSGLLPTGTVTLLLADVEGSTRLWETQAAVMTAAIARFNQVVCDVVAAYDGVRPVEQGEGDSFVAAFARASDAVAAALALQRAPLAPIRLRIGVHTGEIQLRDEGNYAGPAINRTARLRDLAHGGQTVLSGATEDMVVDLRSMAAVSGWDSSYPPNRKTSYPSSRCGCLPFTASASAVGRRSDGTGWRLDCARRRRMRQVMSGQMSTDTTPLHLDQDHAPGGMFSGGHWSGSGSGGGGYWPYVPAGSPFRDARCSASARAATLACSARRSCSRRQYR